MLVVFSGADGAGKSTQIDLLKSYIQCNGYSVQYLWSRGGYTPGFQLVKKIVRLIVGNRLPSSGVSDNREAMLKKRSVSSLWLKLAILDLILFYAVYTRFLHCYGKVVICDRYIEDTYLDFTHNFGNAFNANSLLWRLLVLLAPKPNKAFLLTVPVDVSLYRSTLKNEPFPDTPETLAWRLSMYMDDAFFPSDRFFKIDCQQSIEDVQQSIQDQMNQGA